MMFRNKYPITTIILLFMACICALFVSSGEFVNPQVTPKWLCLMFCAGVAGLVAAFCGKRRITLRSGVWWLCFGVCIAVVFLGAADPYHGQETTFYLLLLLLATQIAFRAAFRHVAAVLVISGMALAGYGILQYIGVLAGSANFPVTGSFDNPAGFAGALTCIFPMGFLFFKDVKPYLRYGSMVMVALMAVAVVLSGSRTGMLACMTALAAYLLAQSKAGRQKSKIIIAAVLIALPVAFYLLKKDSADGRLLIWRCTWEMIADCPLLGHGQGAFRAKYMYYQAGYLESRPDSRYADLADNTQHPFNEFLLVAAEHGLVGLGVMMLLAVLLVRAYLRDRSDEKQVALFGLLALEVFSCFSYPFRYPFTWVAAAINITHLAVPVPGGKEQQTRLPAGMMRIAQGAAFLLLSVVLLFHTITQTNAELQWNRIARLSLAGKTTEVLPEYDKLYRRLGRNGLFLYNHAAELHEVKEYEKSIAVFGRCMRYFNDMDVQVLLADNCRGLGKHGDAERHLKTAAAMCPVRFMPLYELAKLYETSRCHEKAIALAKTILNKRVKVPSPAVNAIKNEMRQLIEAEAQEPADSIPAAESRASEKTGNKKQPGPGELPDTLEAPRPP